jgi:hypothetical protein
MDNPVEDPKSTVDQMVEAAIMKPKSVDKKLYSISDLILKEDKQRIQNKESFKAYYFIHSSIKENTDEFCICNSCSYEMDMSSNVHYEVTYETYSYENGNIKNVVNSVLPLCTDCRSFLRVFFDYRFDPNIQDTIKRYFPIVFKEVKLIYPRYFYALTRNAFDFIYTIVSSIQKRKLNIKWNVIENENQRNLIEIVNAMTHPIVTDVPIEEHESNNDLCFHIENEFQYIRPINSKIVKAIKPHICNSCNQIIQPPNSYHTHRIKIHSKLVTYKTCLDCLSLQNVFFDNTLGLNLDYMISKLKIHIKSMPKSERHISESIINNLTFKSIQLINDLIYETNLDSFAKKEDTND